MKREGGGGQWVLRVTVHGRWREMGLGAATEISLKDARATAAKWCNLAAQQVDPIKQREKDRRAAQRNLHILANIAKDAFESRKAELKGDGEAGRWWTPLKLGKVPVAEIDQTDIRHAIAPIWHSKADIAKSLEPAGDLPETSGGVGLGRGFAGRGQGPAGGAAPQGGQCAVCVVAGGGSLLFQLERGQHHPFGATAADPDRGPVCA